MKSRPDRVMRGFDLMHSNHQKMDTILGGQLHLESELKKWKTRIFRQARSNYLISQDLFTFGARIQNWSNQIGTLQIVRK